MKNSIKTLKNSEKAITLISLVVTIIVLLILAGISISMLSGDNGILQKATDAKINTEKAQIIENAQTDILAQQTDNKGANITKEQLATILNKYFKPTETTSIPDEVSSEHDLELTTIDDKYTINLSKIFKGKILTQNNVVTIGEKYENNWIGKKISYTANNGESNWIIIGKDDTGDILITTTYPVGSYTSKWGAEYVNEFIEYLQTECELYSGKIGENNIEIKEARSMKSEDVTKSIEVSEENKVYINSNGSKYWLSDVYYYMNGDGARASYVRSYAEIKSQTLFQNAQYMGSTSATYALRPVVVLDKTIPYEEVKDLIGDYMEYGD